MTAFHISILLLLIVIGSTRTTIVVLDCCCTINITLLYLQWYTSLDRCRTGTCSYYSNCSNTDSNPSTVNAYGRRRQTQHHAMSPRSRNRQVSCENQLLIQQASTDPQQQHSDQSSTQNAAHNCIYCNAERHKTRGAEESTSQPNRPAQALPKSTSSTTARVEAVVSTAVQHTIAHLYMAYSAQGLRKPAMNCFKRSARRND